MRFRGAVRLTGDLFEGGELFLLTHLKGECSHISSVGPSVAKK